MLLYADLPIFIVSTVKGLISTFSKSIVVQYVNVGDICTTSVRTCTSSKYLNKLSRRNEIPYQQK